MNDNSKIETNTSSSAEQAESPQDQTQNAPSQMRGRDMGSDNSNASLTHEVLHNLGQSYRSRFRRNGELDEINKAIEYGHRALILTPEEHPDLRHRYASLGVSYGTRFRHFGDLDDLEQAVKHDGRALKLTPDGDPDLPDRHDRVSYHIRFTHLEDLNDIEKAISHLSYALDLTPKGHPSLPRRHDDLGASYSKRFERLGDPNDLEKALEHRTCALKLTPYDDPDLPDRHSSLGFSYGERFQHYGGLDDLDKALEHRFDALKLTPKGHPDFPRRVSGLAISYLDRFQHLGDLNDLKKAIEYFHRALDMTPEDHPELPFRHASLAASYGERFQRLGELNDVEKALEHRMRALNLTPVGDPELPYRHASLCVSYSNRLRSVGDPNDISKALEHGSRSLELTPEGHPQLPRRHANVGVVYIHRFNLVGELSDLEKAIEHNSCAVDLTPGDHPDLPWYQFNLAISLFLQYEHTNDPSHLNDSLNNFRKASQLSTGPPRDNFQYALKWATHASNYPQLNCVEAYQATIDLLPEFIWLGATTAQRYQNLTTAENLAINAADAAIRQSNYHLALEWLEHARCVVWHQSLMLRSPLEELQSSHPELATRLRTISKKLYDMGSELPAAGAHFLDSVDSEQVGQQRRRLAKEYKDLLAKTRTLSGFEDFLRPTKANRLTRAAQNSLIVVVNCHQDRCDALIIMPGQDDIKHLPLPGFNEQKAQSARSNLETSLRRSGLRQRGVKMRLLPGHRDQIAIVLLALWNHVVKPILDVLGFTNDVSIDNLPHITWCPTGALTFLPLHAAGDYDRPRSRVFDYAISSYTPTLTALLASSPSSLQPAGRVLAIGQAKTPGHTPLPGTSRELACLKMHTRKRVEYSQLIDDQATVAKVLDAMEEHDWVHLACHAHQNVADANKSGFFLHDGTLDLASINRRSFKNKGLAFLSACQTATGDEKLPDEAIHLASGMLMAGYPSVIGTMWSVKDDDAPFVADKVYAELMKEGKVGNGEAGKALHHAVGKLRDKVGEKEFGRWVPYIHIGS
ncbi:hypothetical protein OPQ81_002577 [Rhizoctonia solani]|nr:hypothetical protein OPQ81_002577 [Rhizoctonia solani]